MINVIIADDNVFEREGIKYLLEKEKEHFNVCEVSDGIEALRKIRGQHFDLLITDIKMPLMSGVDLIKSIRNFNQELEVLIISGYDDFNYARQLLSSKVTNYLLKPINSLELIDTIKNIEKFKRIFKESGEYSSPVNQAINIVKTEFASDLTLDLIANRVFLSSAYFSSLFKKEVEVSFIKYLNDYRLEKASILLEDSNMRVNDIAVFVGIPNISYFNRVFKTKYGLTPSKYRKNCN